MPHRGFQQLADGSIAAPGVKVGTTVDNISDSARRSIKLYDEIRLALSSPKALTNYLEGVHVGAGLADDIYQSSVEFLEARREQYGLSDNWVERQAQENKRRREKGLAVARAYGISITEDKSLPANEFRIDWTAPPNA